MPVSPERSRLEDLATFQEAPVDDTAPAGLRRDWRRRPKARWLIGAIVIVVAAAVAVAVSDPFSSSGSEGPNAASNAAPTGIYTINRQDLTSQTQVSATLGYADSYAIVNQAQGTLTALPSIGEVIAQGQILYRVDGNPVALLYGPTPAYRSLSEGVTGADVAELNADLVALGYATTTAIPAGTDDFTASTREGVEKLQAALGETQSGTLSLGQAVFVPSAIRVTSVAATLGAGTQPNQQVLSATSTTRQVSIALSAAQQSEMQVGDKVTITLPNNQTTPGVISSVGTVATPSQNGGPPTITVLVNPTDPAATGSWDQAPVNVTITTGTVHNVLVVPVDALLAQPGGGYAVEAVGSRGLRHLVPVTLGLFDDAEGLVQVSGNALAVGQRVVVPQL